MGASITPFPRSRLPAAMSPTGEYEPIPFVTSDFANITGGATTLYAVRIGGMVFCETDNASLAARAATALDELLALGFRPSAPCVESVVRAGLAATLSAAAGDKPQPPKGA